MAPNGPEKWGCRIRDLFSKIRDLFNKFETYAVIRDYETKKTAGAAEPPEPPSLAPMSISVYYFNDQYSTMWYNAIISILKINSRELKLYVLCTIIDFEVHR